MFPHKKYLLLGGVFRLTEVALEKALLWDVCLLHMNELPFKEFFKVRNMWKLFSLIVLEKLQNKI